jgi:hypothetical protein
MTLRRLPPPLLATAVALLILGGIAAAIYGVAPDYANVRAGRADAGYLESGDCRKCHLANYTSWHRTFHRTMTQEASTQSVRGDFEQNNTFVYQGVRAEMVRENDSHWMSFTDAAGVKQKFEVVRTVGSRRIQQYLTKKGDTWVRLPVAYDLVQDRWMHLNGSFFFPDGTNYNQQVAEWNVNCVFCHNVKAQPNLDWVDRSWNTEVAELGIACGACHGPAGQHAAHAQSPAYALPLETKRSGRAAARRGEPREARLRPQRNDLRSLPRPARSRSAASRPHDDESRSIRCRRKPARFLQAGAARPESRRIQLRRAFFGPTAPLASPPMSIRV